MKRDICANTSSVERRKTGRPTFFAQSNQDSPGENANGPQIRRVMSVRDVYMYTLYSRLEEQWRWSVGSFKGTGSPDGLRYF
jgi:hypothetical protein